MINGYQAKIMDVYEKIRDEESKNLELRRNEIRNLYPEIMDIDNLIQKRSLQLSMAILKSKDADETIKKFRNEITDLRVKKCEMLVSKGYDPDYLTLKYRCNKCQDTGFIGINKCSCYKPKLIKLYYQNSLLEDTLREKNFDNFDLNLFSMHKVSDDKFSPRKNIDNIVSYITSEYLPNFNNSNTNLLFYGNPGSGKSYLSYCIAKELLDLGFLVVYKTSEELIRDLRDIKFNNNTKLEELLIECDLLIIDDLGAESKSDFSITELFNLINRKLLRNKKMLISTNLSLPNITNIYSERIYSRLLGDFKLFKFYSDDIRIKLNLKNKR